MTKIEEFKLNLVAMRDKLEPLLKGDTDKFIQIAQNYVENTPSLLEKDRASLFTSIIRAAQNGLYLDGQEAALVPFKGQVKFMSMYKGLLKQVRNSGELESINCGVVYEKDVFEYFVDEIGEHIKHVPSFVKDRGKPVSIYSIARIKGGRAPYIEVMTEEEIQNCKKSSRAGDDSPWNGLFADEMRKKTVLRRISKRLPMSTDLNASIHADDDLFIPPENDQELKPEPEKTSTKLRDAVAPKEEPKAEPNPEPKKEEPPESAEYVEGVVSEYKVNQFLVGGTPTDRFYVSVGKEHALYGTFNAEVGAMMKSAHEKKCVVWIIFQKKINTKNKTTYNEAIDVKFLDKLPDDEIPI